MLGQNPWKIKMILGSSKDPVLIKKIYLRIWTLRDEVEAVISERISSGETDSLSVEDLIQEYKSRSPLEVAAGGSGLEVLDGGKAEDETEAEASEESAEENPEENSEEKEEASADSSEESSEEEASANDGEDKSEAVNVMQRRPKLPEGKLYKGTTVLTELNMEEMYFFSNQSFLEGQSIVIEFMIPNKFVLNADVFYSRPYNHKSRIIRDTNLIYRVAVRYSFLKPGERTLLRQFVQSVEPDLSKHAKPKAAPKKEADSFDDLDDLDL
jgi:hypothetical protein